MDILLVTELFPPVAHTQAFGTAKFAQALTAAGHSVHVLAPPNDYWRNMVLDGSEAWKRPMGSLTTVPVPRSKLARHAANGVAKARSLLPGLKGWHESARRAALDLAAERRFDLVVTRYNPARTAWIGRALKRRFGVPWIAYFPDPAPRFLEPAPYGPGGPRGWSERWHLRRLRGFLREADALAFPCERLALYTTRALGLAAVKVVILPHISWRADRPAEAPDGIEILHAGIFMEHRYPEALLRGFEALRDRAVARDVEVRVVFLGETHAEGPALLRKRGLGDLVRFPGLVSSESALARIEAATALLLIEAPLSEGIFLPSKFCDYTRAGRPVLAFSPTTGTVADVMGRDHPGLLGQTEAGARAGLERFFDAAASGDDAALAPWTVDGSSRYSPESVVASFEAQVRSLR